MEINPDRHNRQRPGLNNDPHRPQFHFLPPANWMNDPNGLIQWQGQYHMFYQHNPYAPVHGLVHWGHAVSTDLVHWIDLPLALTPGPVGPDSGGCWSGCAVDNNGVPALLYTGVFPQAVCLASGSSDLVSWQKFEGNPVIAGPPAELVDTIGGQFRDPFVWSEDGVWYLIIGSRQKGIGGMILLYRSHDLKSWEYLHPLAVGDSSQDGEITTGVMWECPNFLDLGEWRALLISTQDRPWHNLPPFYFTGPFQDHQFKPGEPHVLAYGNYFHAPLTLRDDNGRFIMWGWLPEGRTRQACETAGWAGTMSLPIVVSAGEDGRLKLAPAPELAQLRKDHRHNESMNLAPGPETTALLNNIKGNCLEILAEIELEKNSEISLNLLCSPDGKELTRVVFQPARGQIVLDRASTSLDPTVENEPAIAPLDLPDGKRIKLHIFLDRSVIEIFVNDYTYLASRVYPTRPDSLGLIFNLVGGSAKLNSLDTWAVEEVWNINRSLKRI